MKNDKIFVVPEFSNEFVVLSLAESVLKKPNFFGGLGILSQDRDGNLLFAESYKISKEMTDPVVRAITSSSLGFQMLSKHFPLCRIVYLMTNMKEIVFMFRSGHVYGEHYQRSFNELKEMSKRYQIFILNRSLMFVDLKVAISLSVCLEDFQNFSYCSFHGPGYDIKKKSSFLTLSGMDPKEQAKFYQWIEAYGSSWVKSKI